MRTIKTLRAFAAAAAALLGVQGCALLSTPWSLISTGSSIVGGVANGAIMGGSVLGVIRDKAAGAGTDGEADSTGGPPPDVPVAGDNGQRIGSRAPQRACYPGEADNFGLPCS